LEIRSVKFLDEDTLRLMFSEGSKAENFPYQWIVICAETKIFFYDYISDLTRVITSNELDSKAVRVVQAIDT
jgi:hypothetical protein